MTTNTMDTLRAHLFDTLAGIRAGDIDIDRAKAVCEVSQTIINTAKAESDFAKATGMAVSSSLIEVKSPPPPLLPPAAAQEALADTDSDAVRRVTKTGVIERQGHVTRHTMR
ncbi:hypothetical protein [Thauera aromatica]|uniref:hypothetical protein n=1 Tax=Thauera aromatica TaxID=59405 RepID=UPI001FFD465F|nr:hypothetical protein [Thauera aromatica]MCK2097249.1 hypothetical protein [Thauera aromatica]